MREIEFRGVCNVRNIWVYGSLCDTNESLLIVSDVHHIDGQDYCLECSDVIPETVGQFTSFTDGNGAKIYKGDICRARFSDFMLREFDKTGQVSFKHGAFVLCFTDQDHYLSDFEPHEIEVIGNIHEKQSAD